MLAISRFVSCLAKVRRILSITILFQSIIFTRMEPIIVEGPMATYAAIGYDTELYCKVRDKGIYELYWLIKNTTYQFLIGPDRNINPTVYPRIEIVADVSLGTYNIVLHNVNEHDGGMYKCLLAYGNTIVTESSTVNLTILQDPVKPPQPPTCSISGLGVSDAQTLVWRENDRLYIVCSNHGGIPPSHLKWYKNTTPISESMESINNHSLILSAKDHQSTYSCVETHPGLSMRVTCDVMFLNVLHKPVVNIRPATCQQNIGGTCNFYCEITAYPEIIAADCVVRNKKNIAGNYTTLNNSRYVFSRRFNINVIMFDLKIENITSEDYTMELICHAENSEGNSSRVAKITMPTSSSPASNNDLLKKYFVIIGLVVGGVVILLIVAIISETYTYCQCFEHKHSKQITHKHTHNFEISSTLTGKQYSKETRTRWFKKIRSEQRHDPDGFDNINLDVFEGGHVSTSDLTVDT